MKNTLRLLAKAYTVIKSEGITTFIQKIVKKNRYYFKEKQLDVTMLVHGSKREKTNRKSKTFINIKKQLNNKKLSMEADRNSLKTFLENIKNGNCQLSQRSWGISGSMEKVSLIIVNHNGREYLESCLKSIYESDLSGVILEIIIVDNASNDNSIDFVKTRYREVLLVEMTDNNYVKAINDGIRRSSQDLIILLNNDTLVDRNWLKGLCNTMHAFPHAGVVQSKILFFDCATLNSVGVTEVEDFYFRDLGFMEKDRGQYQKIKEISYFSGGSVMIRRRCLEQVGYFDEDFIIFLEDIDFSIRCRNKGWKILYAPISQVYHKFHGTATSDLCDFFCSRNRFLCLAKHFPERLPGSVKTSHFYSKENYNQIYDCLLDATLKVVEFHEASVIFKTLEALQSELRLIMGFSRTYNFFSHLELALCLRKPRIAIYDHAFHFPGGGQRYVAEMASQLQEKYDVTYIVNKEIELKKYRDWFNIDLSKCKLKVIKIPFFEKTGEPFINEGAVMFESQNPFDVISEDSLNYDILINANMLTKVRPQSIFSIFVCHFPDRKRGRFFYVDDYNCIISNGSYTSSWIAKRWKLQPAHLLYPPVDMYNPKSNSQNKKSIILSVARFEVSGSKKQIEMAKAFANLARKDRELLQGWTLVLAGGTFPGNPYFDKVKHLVESLHCNIELRPDVTYEELRTLYRDAAIFWHACGLKEKDPHRVEHFGMTTVEAMQNFCVPVVIDGGGQREIVEHNVSGLRFKTVKHLQEHTKTLISNAVLRQTMAESAYNRSHSFDMNVFRTKLDEIFTEIETELKGRPIGIQGLVGNAKQKG